MVRNCIFDATRDPDPFDRTIGFPPRAFGIDRSSIAQATKELFDEEWVALCSVMQRVSKFVVGLVIRPRVHEHANAFWIEPLKVDPLEQAVTAQIDQRSGEEVASDALGFPISPDDQDRRARWMPC